MLFGGAITVYCENHTEHINALCGQNAEYVKESGTYTNHRVKVLLSGHVMNVVMISAVFMQHLCNTDFLRPYWKTKMSTLILPCTQKYDD
jgi:hypothetical protein